MKMSWEFWGVSTSSLGFAAGISDLLCCEWFAKVGRSLVSGCPPCAKSKAFALQQTSGRAFPTVNFWYLSVECPFNKLYGIDCRPKLGPELLEGFFHRRRQVSPPLNNATHRFLGSQHFRYYNFAVGSRHSRFPNCKQQLAGLPRPYLRTRCIYV